MIVLEEFNSVKRITFENTCTCYAGRKITSGFYIYYCISVRSKVIRYILGCGLKELIFMFKK